MIITISGLAGSGTTTLSKILSKKLNYKHISAGDIFRKMAEERNMSLLEFSKFAEENEEIDIKIDEKQAELAKNSDNLIIEGRLSGHFVDADLKVWLTAPFDVRAKRISKRESKPLEVVKKEIKRREKSEALRYKKIHGIDINNLDIYDLIINSSTFSAEEIAEIIIKALEVIQWRQ
ncbi:cytidylate kinase [Methanothermus fervidus DSM 2088]|uniref:Cytidylate kinase n=1 Tax=Methanothermus fervidus (strain ATCC 43054 / DSM 2088 / JCM 10308 / V24 S) TaxID=523846 RepID=E3GZE6_METFV|nr:AAA family ATPase [Methanothermus fervidus]ADP77678.1 cytidylate kinase [Methanothermus fervidus DSM 2088]